MNNLETRKQILTQFGASEAVCDELLAYNTNVFDHAMIETGVQFPLADEPFVASWETYAAEAKQIGVMAALRKRLVQLNFPIQEGISATEEYQQAVKKGIVSEQAARSPGVVLRSPDKISLLIHPTPAGKIPVMIAYEREDFVTLIQALTCKNEPKPVPDAQGATMVAGYNNWDRIAALKAALQREQGAAYTEELWAAEFLSIIPQKHLYQDKFILLSRSYYSGVTPDQFGLDEAAWREKSLIIRREHECTHYFTKRVLASMQNKVLDELIADYAGITAAAGKFKADWFLAFVGLENYPAYREGGRLQNYKGTPPLSDGAFEILQTLVYHAARNLENSPSGYPQDSSETQGINPLIVPLSYLTLEALAAKEALHMISS